MTEACIRVQLISDRERIDAFSQEVAAANSVVTEPHEMETIPKRGLRRLWEIFHLGFA